ncbi:MAG TPA: type II toxin-antitoxin system ParD family antitoxin [Phycisphaerae bacterium]|nr:type II toxin-antitoxin system ParD family antitoxin [Phycisphaerae bacterium]
MANKFNISIPSPLKKWVDKQAAEKGYGTADKFVLEVLQREQALEQREKIDARLIEAIESGPSTPMTAIEWERIRAAGRRRARERRRK